MVCGINYDVYEWFMFMNGCILVNVVLMDITWSNDLVVLEI